MGFWWFEFYENNDYIVYVIFFFLVYDIVFFVELEFFVNWLFNYLLCFGVIDLLYIFDMLKVVEVVDYF